MHVSKELSDVSLTLLDAEYLLCQYFQFHLASTEAVKDEVKRCSVPNCQRDTLEKWIKEHSVLLDHFLEEACTNHDQPTCTAVASKVPGEVADDRVEQLKAVGQTTQQANDLLRETLVFPNFYIYMYIVTHTHTHTHTLTHTHTHTLTHTHTHTHTLTHTQVRTY